MNETYDPLRTIFAEALEITDAAQRDAYVVRACGADLALRRDVEELLRANAMTGSFLPEQPVAAGAQSVIAEAAAALRAERAIRYSESRAEKPGDRIGRYKLLQQIGEGGCGVVYMAEQQEPVRRRVALKVIKLGMDTKQVIARFDAERQALALMDHPNIAKVLDGGATDTGRPYFVMELVEGVPFTRYCDESKLDTRRRVELFIRVCKAVQHAHQKGIIHRDIKPSNILVRLHDGVPVPKVIDFGIAKATGGRRLTDQTLFTAVEQFIGTPAYMSPEQAELSGLDIDTRSDIYSLGVLLYELLTGKVPFEPKEMAAAGRDEMRRIIREKEPVRPSTRINTLEAAEQKIIAARRALEASKLIHLVRGDLDWIVMKCLEKDRTRRYDTANGVALDLERYLNNEPVVARPPRSLYRLQKLVGRNRLVFAAAATVAGALLIGLLASTWLFIKERRARQTAVRAEREQARARDEAKTEAVKSEQVAQFLKNMLKSVRPSVALGRDTKLMRAVLDEAAGRISTELANEPAVEAELRSIMGEGYLALGEAVKAEAIHREALAIRIRLLGNQHPLVADSLVSVASALRSQGKLTEAEAIQRQALTIQKRIFGNEHPKVATSLGNLAAVLDDDGRHVEAEGLSREALVLSKKLFGNEHPEVARALGNFAVVLDNEGKLAEAEMIQREAIALQRKLLGDSHPDVATTLYNLARLLVSQSRQTEAEPVYREALALQEKVIGKDHPDFASTLHYLARLLAHEGKLAEAEPLFRESLGIRKKVLGEDHPAVASSLKHLTGLLLRENKFDEAERLFTEVLPSTVEKSPFLVARADFRARRGRFAEAAADLTRAIHLKPDDQMLWRLNDHLVQHMLAGLLVQTAAVDAYREHCRESLDHVSNVRDHNTAHWIAKDCLILVSSGADLETVGRMADLSLAVGTNHSSWPAFAATKGLAEYRQGNFTGAVDWSERVLLQASNYYEQSRAWLQVQTYAVLAMARFQLKQFDSARLTLRKCEEVADAKLPKLESGNLEEIWLDWIFAHALLHEAKCLIRGDGKS